VADRSLGTHSARALVRVSHGSVVRGATAIWSDLNLDVFPGEFTAILGPNGSGKSTLLQVLLGRIQLAEGTAEVIGAPPGIRRADIGYLPQHRAITAAERIRAIDIVRLGLTGARWGFRIPGTGTTQTRHERAQIHEALELVGASHYAQRAFGELSGGEQQRVLIAQAIVRRPAFLLLDEPLDSLDLPTQTSVVALIREVCTRQQIGVLLVAHDVNPLLSALDQVLYIANGHALQGAVNDVISSSQLTALFGMPIEVLTAADGRRVVIGTPDAPHHHGHRHSHDHDHH